MAGAQCRGQEACREVRGDEVRVVGMSQVIHGWVRTWK